MPKPAWQIEMLGGLRACHEGREPIVLSRQQTGTLFAYLALNLNRVHSRESLMALIWPDDAPEEASHKLRQSLYALRRQLGAQPAAQADIFITTRTTIQLDPALFTTDVRQFEQTLQAAVQCAGIGEKIRFLKEAVGLYRGELLPGFYLDEIEPERRRLADLHRGALQVLIRAYEETGDLNRAIETGQCALALDPMMEEAHCDLMRVYAAQGQPSSVSRQYQALASILKKELGEEPTPGTKLLMESLRQKAQEIAASFVAAPRIGASASIDITAPNGEHAVNNDSSRLSAAANPALPAHSHAARFRVSLAALGAAICLIAAWKTFGVNNAHTKTAVGSGATSAAPSGTLLWKTNYVLQPGDKTSEAVAVVTDPKDYLYVTGFVDTNDHDVDFLTLKYDENGHQLWEARYNGPGNDVDRAVDIAVDGKGNVYITGESDNGKGNGATRLAGLDFATIKYDSKTGKQIWVRRYNGPDNGEDRPVRLKVDDNGVYVLGKSWGRGETDKAGFDFALVKYDPDGNQKWVYRYDGGVGDDGPVDMALGRDGSIYITGQSAAKPASGPEGDMLTLKISKEGNKIWEARYGANNQADDCPCKITVDRGGNAYVIGTGRGLPGTPDAARTGCLVIKYDANGNRLYVRGTDQERYRIEMTNTATVNDEGEVIAYGKARDKNGSLVGRLVYRDVNGLTRWSDDILSLAGEDGLNGVSLGNGGVLLCGGAHHSEGNYESRAQFCTARYDNNGSQKWRNFLDTPAAYGRARSIIVNKEYVIAVGQYCDERTHDFAVACYQQ